MGWGIAIVKSYTNNHILQRITYYWIIVLHLSIPEMIKMLIINEVILPNLIRKGKDTITPLTANLLSLVCSQSQK